MVIAAPAIFPRTACTIWFNIGGAWAGASGMDPLIPASSGLENARTNGLPFETKLNCSFVASPGPLVIAVWIAFSTPKM
ncbi:MAG: hypothetical protein WKF77_19875 [Planctomycetaceae bacterium]